MPHQSENQYGALTQLVPTLFATVDRWSDIRPG